MPAVRKKCRFSETRYGITSQVIESSLAIRNMVSIGNAEKETTMNAHEIAQRYIEIWNETDAGRRRAAIDRLYTEDCAYTDPLGAVSGRAGIDAFIAGVQQKFPGIQFRLAGAVDAHHEQARFTWHAGAPGGEPAAIGFDVALLSGGRIRSIYGFLDKAPS
jgi:hypothetical protein